MNKGECTENPIFQQSTTSSINVICIHVDKIGQHQNTNTNTKHYTLLSFLHFKFTGLKKKSDDKEIFQHRCRWTWTVNKSPTYITFSFLLKCSLIKFNKYINKSHNKACVTFKMHIIKRFGGIWWLHCIIDSQEICCFWPMYTEVLD